MPESMRSSLVATKLIHIFWPNRIWLILEYGSTDMERAELYGLTLLTNAALYGVAAAAIWIGIAKARWVLYMTSAVLIWYVWRVVRQ